MFLASLLMRYQTENLMTRKLFHDEQQCLIWIKAQPVPPWAYGWWIECFDSEGNCVSSKGIS